MEPLLSAAVYGGFGGICRGALGLWKQIKDQPPGTLKKIFNPGVAVVSTGLSAGAAVLVYYAANDVVVAPMLKDIPLVGEVLAAGATPIALILAGYVGVDLFDTLNNLLKRK